MSNSLWPCRLQHARLPCPSPSPRICSNSCLLSQWCHPTISWPSSPSVAPFSFCHQSFLVSGSFIISWLSTSRSQSIGASASVKNSHFQIFFLIYGGFLLCCWLKHVHRLPDGYYNKRCETASWESSEYAVQRVVFKVWLYRSRNRGLGQVNELHDTSIFQYLNYW